MSRYAYVPRKSVIEVTLACNLRCRHCGSRAGIARADELSLAETERVLEDLASLGCEKVVISGGEALLRPDIMDIIRASSRVGMRTALITNGLLLDHSTCERARSAGLDAVGVSLDGMGRTHDRFRSMPGLFERVLDAFEAARDERLPFCAITTVNRVNLRELEDLHGLLRREGAYAWQIQPALTMGEICVNPEMAVGERDIPAIASQVAARITAEIDEGGRLPIHVGDSLGYFGPSEATLRRFSGGSRFPGCRAGMDVVGIESNGDVKGCLSIHPGQGPLGERWVEGNVRDTPLASIWNHPDAFAYNRKWKLSDLGGPCAACRNAVQCRGGCRSSMETSGDGTWNPMCELRVLDELSVARPNGVRNIAAATVLASALGIGMSGCRHVAALEDEGAPDSGADAGSDTDSEPQTVYGMPDTEEELDTDTDTEIPEDAGGIPVYSVEFPVLDGDMDPE